MTTRLPRRLSRSKRQTPRTTSPRSLCNHMGDVNKAELKAALQGLTDSHRATANHLSALSTMVTGMTEEQVDETTARVATELGAVQGWQHITQSFDRAQIALVLTVGVRKVEEFEILKGKRAKNDVTPFLRLQKYLVPTPEPSRNAMPALSTGTHRRREVLRGSHPEDSKLHWSRSQRLSPRLIPREPLTAAAKQRWLK